MNNLEKYFPNTSAEEMLDILVDVGVDKETDRPQKCDTLGCENCKFNKATCKAELIEFLKSSSIVGTLEGGMKIVGEVPISIDYLADHNETIAALIWKDFVQVSREVFKIEVDETDADEPTFKKIFNTYLQIYKDAGIPFDGIGDNK